MKVDVRTRGGRLRFEVRLIPRAGRNAIAGAREGALVVRVSAAPVAGAANEALIELLAKTLGVARGEIAIERGATSRVKTIGAPLRVLAALQRSAAPNASNVPSQRPAGSRTIRVGGER